MEERKRRASPAGGATGTAAQKRKLSSMANSSSDAVMASGIEDGVSVDASLGLEQGFLEVREEGQQRCRAYTQGTAD